MTADLYVKLSKLNIQLQVACGNLQLQAPKGALTTELLGEVKANKEELIALINSYQGQELSVSPIQPVAAQGSYPLSSSQQRLWLLNQFEKNAAYHIPGVFTFTGSLDFAALSFTFAQLITRHEVLRTCFREDDTGVARQYIKDADDTGFALFHEDLRHEPHREAKALERVQAVINQDFDLAEGPLLRAGVYQLANEAYLFVYVVHHIVSDGWSMGILIRELLQLYNARKEGQPNHLRPLRIQYRDYATWQQEQLKQDVLNAHKVYWLGQFKGPLPLLDLPMVKTRPPVKTYRGGAVSRKLSAGLAKGLKAIVGDHGATLFMGLLGAVTALLYRYTGQEDFIIGSPVAGREHQDLEDQIGFYVNTLALRTQLKGIDSFRELLGKVKEVTLAAYEHQMYPFDELVDDLNLRRDPSRSPLFDVMVVLQNGDIYRDNKQQKMGNLLVAPYPLGGHHTSKFDLTFTFWEVGDEIQATLEYNSDLFNQHSIERLADHLVQLLAAILAEPLRAIVHLDYLSEPERHQLLVGFNDTSTAYPAHLSVGQLFEEQAGKTPHAIALAFEETALSYRQLNEKANQLARYLLEKYAIQPEDRLGVQLERNEWLLTAILAILKAGGAYVPLEFTDPPERIAYMRAESGCRLVLDADELALFRQEADLYNWANLDFHPAPDSLCYVMFTSGTTGRPKGVLIEHRSVVRLVKETNYVALTGADVLLVTGAVGFDATTFEYWGMLLNGGQVVLCRKDTLLDAHLLAAEIRRKKVNIMWFTASWLNHLIDSNLELFAGIDTLLAGGDKLSPPHIQALKHRYPGLRIINGYGPTENTTFSLSHAVLSVAANIPVGKPISNSTVDIVGPYDTLMPIGVTGEIWVGGDGLARGYLNQPELTAEKFVENPFRPGARAYRTGDLGKWLADGTIEFIGRKDSQLKIRGYRLEPGEVEAIIQEHPAVKLAVVVAITPAVLGEQQLVAYVVGTGKLEPAELKSFVGRKAPAYMIPNYVVQLKSLPLTSNGKVDKSQLPAVDSLELGVSTAYTPPANAVEERLVAVWQQILNRERIGTADNFFELGGHSLHMTRLSHAISTQFGVKIVLRKLYERPTIARLAAEVIALLPTAAGLALLPETAQNQSAAQLFLQELLPGRQRAEQEVLLSPEVLPPQPHYAVTHNQHKEFIRYSLVGKNTYNISTYLVFDHLDKAILQNVLHAIWRRHESLRTVFVRVGATVQQRVLDSMPAGFEVKQMSIRGQDQQKAVQELAHSAENRLFDFEQELLCDFIIVDYDDQRSVLLFTLHHAISDANSMRVLEKEIRQLYEAFSKGQPDPLPPLTHQYKDYAHWANTFLAGSYQAAARTFYEKHILDSLSRNRAYRAQRGLPPAGAATGRDHSYRQELLTELTQVLGTKPTKAMLGEAYGRIVNLVPPPGGMYEYCLQEPLLGRLKQLALSLDSSLTMLMLASFAVLYSTTHQEQNVRIYVPVSTRDPKEFEGVVGWLMSEMILTVEVDPLVPLKILVSQTMESFFEAFTHRFYPYERIMADLDLNLCQLAPLFVNYIKRTERPVDYFSPRYRMDGTSHFDFRCTIIEYSNGMELQINHNAQLYGQLQIEEMFAQHTRILERMSENAGGTVKELL